MVIIEITIIKVFSLYFLCFSLMLFCGWMWPASCSIYPLFQVPELVAAGIGLNPQSLYQIKNWKQDSILGSQKTKNFISFIWFRNAEFLSVSIKVNLRCHVTCVSNTLHGTYLLTRLRGRHNLKNIQAKSIN